MTKLAIVTIVSLLREDGLDANEIMKYFHDNYNLQIHVRD